MDPKGVGELAKVAPAAMEKARMQSLVRALSDLADADLAIGRAADKAPQLAVQVALGEDFAALIKLPLEELRAKGWSSREELMVAYHTLLPLRETPSYTHFANKRNELRWRDGTGEKPSVAVNVFMPQPRRMTDEERRQAPVIEVNGK